MLGPKAGEDMRIIIIIIIIIVSIYTRHYFVLYLSLLNVAPLFSLTVKKVDILMSTDNNYVFTTSTSYYYYYYYYSHIFPDSRAQHCNYATLLAGFEHVATVSDVILEDDALH